jgi:hypothetical protein
VAAAVKHGFLSLRAFAQWVPCPQSERKPPLLLPDSERLRFQILLTLFIPFIQTHRSDKVSKVAKIMSEMMELATFVIS